MTHRTGRFRRGVSVVEDAVSERERHIHRSTSLLAGLLALAATCCAIGGCGGSSGGIAGTYVLQSDSSQSLVLRQDGSYTLKGDLGGTGEQSVYTGKWRLEGGELLILCGLRNGTDFCDRPGDVIKRGTVSGGRFTARSWLEPEVWVKQ